MNPDQIEVALKELENRMERVRVLYEQYFMGLERRTPDIPFKDVERRLYELQKLRFNSTALRFRFQSSVQRFSTLRQHWTRTCREIDSGTYQPHVQRAQRRFAAPELPVANSDTGDGRQLAERSSRVADQGLGELLDENIDLDAELKASLAALEEPRTRPGLLGNLSGLRPGSGSPPGATVKISDAPQAAGPAVPPRLSLSPKPAGLAALAPRPAKNPAANQDPRAPAQPRQPPAAGPAKPVVATPAGLAQVPPRPGQPLASPLTHHASPRPKTLPQKVPQATAQAPTGLSDERIRALHASYIQARRQTNASDVSFEKLARSIRETESKLKEQSKGREVDFDVAIKAGKAILTPRLK